MNKTYIDILGGYFFIIMGLLLVIFRKQIAQKTVDFYYELFHAQFTQKGYEVGFLLIGLFFAIFGFLTILGFIKFR
jgi:hypothetical protein